MQPVAGMDLPRISCVTLQLNTTMTTPLTQFHSRMNPITDSRRTNNLLSIHLTRKMTLLALPSFALPLPLPCLNEILRSSPRRSHNINLPLVSFHPSCLSPRYLALSCINGTLGETPGVVFLFPGTTLLVRGLYLVS